MTAPLTGEDLAVLARLRSVGCPSPTCTCALVDRELADAARVAAPEVDDATLAKILLSVAQEVIPFARHNDLSGSDVGAVIGRAAAELAALELGDPNA